MANTDILQLIKRSLPAGGRVLWHAGQSECKTLLDTLIAHPDTASRLTFAGLFIPGINSTDFTALTATTRMESIFVAPAHRKAFMEGRMDFLPMHYSNYPAYLEKNPADLAILHVPPARNGVFSCGPTADIADNVKRYAKKIIVIVNRNLPFTHGATALHVDEADAIVEIDSPLQEYPSDQDDAVTSAIARNVAELVRDGDTLQCGIGRVPASILRALSSHRNLRIYSGMIIDEVADLARDGALATGSREKPNVTAGIAAGTQRLMDFIQSENVAFHGNRVTHNALRIAEQHCFTAINSAIEVDLFGQINCETLGGKQISGIGGGGDFLRAARLAPEGRAIIALPSQSRGQSRIVAQLSAGATSMARADSDYIVSEHGVAQLRHRSLDDRAEALIAIAAPSERNQLASQWRNLRSRL